MHFDLYVPFEEHLGLAIKGNKEKRKSVALLYFVFVANLSNNIIIFLHLVINVFVK